ncbi:DUF6787 family protein [Galbibacter sp.]|jgi:hypothetical protein|uniref:DUF6787 family protein n=1 Tax=Galbibacter sp. TaxID=2918471 RepID=UPI003A929641
MEKLKQRWGISSNFQLVVIFVVFAITGSASAKLAGPFTELLGISSDSIHPILYWVVRLLLIFPIYQVLLVSTGWLFGQFKFFWNFEKKMLRRMGVRIK